MNITNKKITAVVCTYNAESTIYECLNSLIVNNVNEIILVDGKSEDQTVKLAKNFTKLIFYDERKGLAAARNLGISKSTGNYILNCGADNIMTKGSVNIMLEILENNQYLGVGAITRLKYVNNYLQKALDTYKRYRFISGDTNIIGTPTLFARKTLIDNPYKPERSSSDDEELCNRLIKKYQRNFYISKTTVFEHGYDTLKEITKRWRMYGISDYEVYEDYKKNWNICRKFYSISHPVRKDFFQVFLKCNLNEKLKYGIFFIYITFIRYMAWFFSKLRLIKHLNE